MSDFIGEFVRGFRTTEAFYDKLLGQEQVFTDNPSPTSTLNAGVTSGMRSTAVLVKNIGSAVPDPGTAVLWDASNIGTGINGLAGADAAAAGVVDPSLTTGPAQGEKFLLFIHGPVVATLGGSVSAGGKVKTGSSGKLVANSPSAVADLVGAAGRAIAGGGNGDQVRVFVDFRMNK